ncbi:hypothetical protein GPL15_16760 [Clostridium sp. MCC353]|uniref:hypothetical protein n=1 Tax=Clostridium sp. MCC353 TaxID=2592646 RepID=UPI001C02997F|nr:hypothetical protein [Clostridium sp. MCC353]MBT9778153.1 hypothetical protein [Clostridium sp. MCC353]
MHRIAAADEMAGQFWEGRQARLHDTAPSFLRMVSGGVVDGFQDRYVWFPGICHKIYYQHLPKSSFKTISGIWLTDAGMN